MTYYFFAIAILISRIEFFKHLFVKNSMKEYEYRETVFSKK